MDAQRPGYQFGDITRAVTRWLGPSTRAIRGKIDWFKFGKALTLAFLATGTLSIGTFFASLINAVTDPNLATAIPAVAGVVIFVIEQIRRILQGQPADVPPLPVAPIPSPPPIPSPDRAPTPHEDPTDGQSEERDDDTGEHPTLFH